MNLKFGVLYWKKNKKQWYWIMCRWYVLKKIPVSDGVDDDNKNFWIGEKQALNVIIWCGEQALQVNGSYM